MVFGMRHGQFIKGILREIEISEGAIPWFCDNHRGTIRWASKIEFKKKEHVVDVTLKCSKYAQDG